MSLLEQMAADLELDPVFISRVAARASRHYRTFDLRKAGGGIRTIHQPSAVLKTFQYWVVAHVLKDIPVSDCAVGYRIGKSILTNARLHAGQRHLFHTDLTNFFPSITQDRVMDMLENKTNLVPQDRDFVASICLLDGRCTIGAVSSPSLSNAVMVDVDQALVAFAASRGYRYSRYADDMIMSSKDFIPSAVANTVGDILNEFGFRVQQSKTHFMGPSQRRAVTGLVLSSTGSVSAGRDRKESVRRMIYQYYRYDRGRPEAILGHLNFLRGVEPEAYNRIVMKYGQVFGCHIASDLAGKVGR